MKPSDSHMWCMQLRQICMEVTLPSKLVRRDCC